MSQAVVGRPLLKVAASEAKRNWPFLAGFGVTFAIVFKMSLSLKPEDAQKSPFVNPDAHR